MRRMLVAAALMLAMHATGAAAAETVKVAWCARTVTSAAAPFAIANKMGWFNLPTVKMDPLKVELVPLAGSVDCVKYVGTGEVRYALPSIEPLAALRPQGIKAKVFYTAYQGNIYGIAVPDNSPIKELKDLKGKKVGVASMASGGAIVAKAIAATLGAADSVQVIAIGEGAQAAALTKKGEIDALSLYDTQYAVIESLGVALRRIAAPEFDRFPSNGFIALDDTLAKNSDEAAALGQGYAKGTLFAMANPEAAVKILWEQFPQTKATGKNEATALKDDVSTLDARVPSWGIKKAGVQRWGESSLANYQAYLDFLLKWGQIKQAIKADEVVTNDLVPTIDTFAPDAVVKIAKDYK